MIKVLIFTIVAVFMFSDAHAGGGGKVAGATEPTQILNNAQLVLQYAKQTEEYNTQLKQWSDMIIQARQLTASMPWSQTEKVLTNIANAVNQKHALGYDLSRLENFFQTQYANYDMQNRKTGADFFNQYVRWSDSSNESIKAALRAGGLQAENFTNEASTIDQLRTLSRTAEGRMQAIQVGNLIASEQVDSLRSLRQIMIAANQSQSAYMLKQQKIDDSRMETSQALYDSLVGKDQKRRTLQQSLEDAAGKN